MDKVLILRTTREDIATSFSKLIQEEFTGIYVVPLYNGEPRYHIEKLVSTAADIVAVNINCENPLELNEIQVLTSRQKLYMLDFCFSCCRDHHKNKNRLCLPPYITLSRILVARIKSLLETLAELKVRIHLSSQELDQLTNTLGVEKNQISRCMLACLSDEEEKYYSIELPAKNTSITVTATGNTKSSKERIQLNVQYIVREQFEQLSSFSAQIMSMLTLLPLREYFEKDVDVATRIGYEEGLYTLYISKLIERGADFIIQLSP